ncbi:MAG: diguanylate cyclase [Pseudomonadota bacterium]|nr:diguanylate cyclase [Pseudomonadota bacterium]
MRTTTDVNVNHKTIRLNGRVLLAAALGFWWLLLAGAGFARSEVPPGFEAIDLSEINQLDRINLSPFLMFLPDDQSRTIDDLLRGDVAPWQLNTEGVTNFGQSNIPYWFVVQLNNLHQMRDPVYIRLNYPHIDRLDVYWVNDGRIIESYQLGDTVPFQRRPVDNRVYLFPVNGLKLSQVQLYLRVESQGPLEVPLDAITQSRFYEQDKLEMAWYGAYFGIMLAMFFYNFFIFILVRDFTYFYYLFYVLSTTALQFTLTGASFQYLWPQSVAMNNIMVLVLTAIMPLAAVAFVRSFLKLETEQGINRLLGRVLLVAFVGVLASVFVLPYLVVLKIAHAVSFVAVSFGVYLGVVYSIKGVRAARTFALAWLIYLVFILVYLLQITGRTQPNVISIHALEIGSVLELILLSLSFGHRVNEEKEMRIKAQDKALQVQEEVNQNLDKIVRQRTEELEEANLQLKELSIKDGLTGLYNRRHFDELLKTEYQRSFREKSTITVLMMDIDHFKKLNDRYGHQCGDECLKRFARVVADALRRPPDFVARYGGEEFVALLPGTDEAGGQVVAENIRAAVASIAVEWEGQSITMTTSIGVASRVPSDRHDSESLLKTADANLYQAKEAGRNRVVHSPA